jgi:stearoyl-CoA desaturase (delta-9 desaturase)
MTFVYGYLFYYIAAMIGISAGYHRYFSHRSFKTSKVTEIVMLFFGMICGARSPITWCAVHRMHHSTSDTERDPHSPVYKGAKDVILSQWHVSHIPRKYIKDLLSNPRVVFFHRYGKYIHAYFAIAMLMISIKVFVIFVAIPFILAYVGFGFLNYIAHKNGEPTDVPIMNLLAPGEGWHKYHHEHPSASSLNAWDPTGIVIKCLSKF